MFREEFSANIREVSVEKIKGDFVIVGGGMAGVCTAIAAARQGLKVVLVQDRPVLGGNASSEVRLWILGATSHMGNNNRWSREGGIIDEILVENAYRNKEGNPVVLDTVILDKVKSESNITLLLNTQVYHVDKSAVDLISKVTAFNSQTQVNYEISSDLFCDASGDGIVAYGAGASYRMGAENIEEFNEKFAPDPEKYGEMLGHSLYFYTKDAGKPVDYFPPSYAIKDVEKLIPRYRNISAKDIGCKLWWIELGGRSDTIKDTEDIKWELWSVVYGIWDYIKNSGKFPEAKNLTLEWVGNIPGKRESRRFAGYYTLKQDDIIQQTHFDDTIAFGGWAIDLHPADGVYSHESGCTQYHAKGIYEIPYRCYVSKDIKNLFYAGRIISATHVAHGTSRVMATSALGGQAVGYAAAQCLRKNLLPRDLMEPSEMIALQQMLNQKGQAIPHKPINIASTLLNDVRIATSSNSHLSDIPPAEEWYKIDYSIAQLLPLAAKVNYSITVELEAQQDTILEVELRCSKKRYNYTPDKTIEKKELTLKKGLQQVTIEFANTLEDSQYGFVAFLKNEQVSIRLSDYRQSGIVTVFNKFNRDVNNHGKQEPPQGSGIDSFEFWCPERRPLGKNIAMQISPAIVDFSAENVLNGFTRPYLRSNAWVANSDDDNPTFALEWNEPKTATEITLFFDTDFDHALESVQYGHPENIMPFCVQEYCIRNEHGEIVYKQKNNHQSINEIVFEQPITTKSLRFEFKHPSEHVPASLFQIIIK